MPNENYDICRVTHGELRRITYLLDAGDVVIIRPKGKLGTLAICTPEFADLVCESLTVKAITA